MKSQSPKFVHISAKAMLNILQNCISNLQFWTVSSLYTCLSEKKKEITFNLRGLELRRNISKCVKLGDFAFHCSPLVTGFWCLVCGDAPSHIDSRLKPWSDMQLI